MDMWLLEQPGGVMPIDLVPTRAALRRMVKESTHHLASQADLSCEFCPARFQGACDLVLHRRQVHNTYRVDDVASRNHAGEDEEGGSKEGTAWLDAAFLAESMRRGDFREDDVEEEEEDKGVQTLPQPSQQNPPLHSGRSVVTPNFNFLPAQHVPMEPLPPQNTFTAPDTSETDNFPIPPPPKKSITMTTSEIREKVKRIRANGMVEPYPAHGMLHSIDQHQLGGVALTPWPSPYDG
jgi:hypothetical protein